MDALAVTHLRKTKSNISDRIFFSFREHRIQAAAESPLLGKGRCSQSAEGLHCGIHLNLIC